LLDGIGADRLTRRAGQAAREAVAEGERAAGDTVGQGGIGIAVGLVLGIRRDFDGV